MSNLVQDETLAEAPATPPPPPPTTTTTTTLNEVGMMRNNHVYHHVIPDDNSNEDGTEEEQPSHEEVLVNGSVRIADPLQDTNVNETDPDTETITQMEFRPVALVQHTSEETDSSQQESSNSTITDHIRLSNQHFTSDTNVKDKALLRNYTLPDLTNDENAPIKLSSYNSYINDGERIPLCDIYCGRYFGTDIIPHSDGRCGPDDGPSCPSCNRVREEDYTSKREVLKRLFPGLYILFSDRSNTTLRWVHVDQDETSFDKDENGKMTIDLEQYSGYDANDENSHYLDTYLIQLLRKHQGHFGKCVRDIKNQYYELQSESNMPFYFPNDPNTNDDSDNDSVDMIRPIDPDIALSNPVVRPAKTTHYNTTIESICEVTNVDVNLAEFLYQEMSYDIDETIEHIMTEGFNGYSPALEDDNTENDSDDTDEEKDEKLIRYMDVMTEMHEDDNAKNDDLMKATKKRNEYISYAVEHAKEMVSTDIVVEKLKELKVSLDTNMKFEPLSHDEEGDKPSMISIRGHRMLLATKENPFYCRVCTSQVPSKEGGYYYSEQCNLCEGCIQTPYTSLKAMNGIDDGDAEYRGDYNYLHCPMNLNGGHIHQKPLTPAYDKRSHCVCDMCEHHGHEDESHEIAWYNEEEDFDVCIDCMHRPPPKNYSRKENNIVNTYHGDEETFAMNAMISLFNNDADVETDDENGNQIGSTCTDKSEEEDPQLVITHNFGDTAIESEIVAQWEACRSDDRLSNNLVLGCGTIGNSSDTSSTNATAGIQRVPIPVNVCNDGNLPDEAKDALYLLEQPSLDIGLRAAADIAQAEDILRRVAPSVQPEENSSYNTLLDCISAGKLGLAGSLLLSNSYAPACIQCPDGNDSSEEKENTKEELICCCCFEEINEVTAPDGAVGCLGGHAMHAACASDLLLGGGKCPTCRQTLFYSKVAASEIKAAAKFTKDEIERVRAEEEEKVKKELFELARDNLPTQFAVGDVVHILEDKDICKHIQGKDPCNGWWHDDMISACGLEGSITDIISNSEKDVVSIRVKSRGCHKFQVTRRIDDFSCTQCGSNPIGLRHCIHCKECEICCRRKGNECSVQNREWYWSPSLLTLRQRCKGTSPLALTGNSEASKAEQHILRLKGELVAIKTAREAVKETTNELIASQVNLKMPSGVGRQLSQNSNEALTVMADSGIAPADRQRAKHLLSLANQWGPSEAAKAKRAELYQAVKEGQLDSVARIVRRYNAELTAEATRWADASSATSEYIVEPWAIVDLRVLPNSNSPRTGLNLKPNTTFSSVEEILDKDGNMWVKLDPQSVEIEKDNLPLPQGWIRIRPGGDGYAPIVKKKKSCLQCFCCGEDLVPSIPASKKYEVAEQNKVKVGDILLVCSTLEKVKVKSIDEKYIECSYFIDGLEEDYTCGSILYRPCDLVVPKFAKTGDGLNETLFVNRRILSRRELVLSHNGNEELARKDWNAAKIKNKYCEQEFASCPRGHLLHARCLQQTLLNGSRCPAPGCSEQLFLPKVTRDRNDDDTCCGGNDRDAGEVEALRAASELAGQSALVEARSNEGITENNRRTLFNDKTLKMCPMCCSGPLFNQECSDMTAHHGQCSMRALRGKDDRPCSDDGDFRASASEIAAKMTQVSASKSVADLLPRCPTHNCIVMFNGCMNCGHLFTDTDWHDLPDWNPKARAYLELDKKRRNAAQLLTEQIRSEASLLQFERDAYSEANGEKCADGKIIGGWSGDTLDKIIEPPPPRQLTKEQKKEKFRAVYVSSPW